MPKTEGGSERKGVLKSVFFLTNQVSLGCAECPWYISCAFLGTTRIPSPKLEITCPFLSLLHARTSVKRPTVCHFVALGRCAIDNEPQFASVGRVSTLQDHTAAQPRTAARQTPVAATHSGRITIGTQIDTPQQQ